ncbi:hypothetical protein E2C01_062828 [Portunus trituberculatus]|uniref:Uncharacterized protein n=1 Tax=Portunus trituberculatus TaxID=210409 RepID=A0A5B7HGI4_PORTR|nr:hypothetical protein [Portunus trituberculatus]
MGCVFRWPRREHTRGT